MTGIVWLDSLLEVLSAWGYLAVVVAGALENLFVVGGFMPGETIVTAVAFLASRDPDLNIVLVWVLSVLGTVIGSNISYAIGRRGGRPLLDRWLRRSPRLLATLDQAEHYFEIHGTYTVVLSRFTAGFKNFVPALAGVARMKIWVFEAYTLLGAAVYSTALCVIGYEFGDNIEAILSWFKRAGIWAMVVLAALIAVYVATRLWRARRITRQISGHIAAEVDALAKSDLWVSMSGGGPTGSTNDDARELAEGGAPEGAVVLASRQTAGRGRLGRAWNSPRGGVYLSVILRPSLDPEDVVLLSPAIGLGVALGLERLGITGVGVKWPNDVWLRSEEGKSCKLAGVLLESKMKAGRIDWVVAGVGINVLERPHGHDAACVADVVGSVSRPEVAAAVLDGIAEVYRALSREGFSSLLARYEERDVLRGSEVTVRDAAGEIVADGVAAGVDGRGRLVVRGREGDVPVSAGEVTLRAE